MSEEKEADITGNSDSDMMTQLPDPILENILFLLPTADAAGMSTVSKYWLNLWNSFIILHFSFHESTQKFENFLPLVEDSLFSLPSPAKNPIIHSFTLNMHFGKERRSPFDMDGVRYISEVTANVNDWIGLVLKYCVKHLKLIFTNIQYNLPSEIFMAKSFLSMHIQGCSIMGYPFFSGDNAPFNCLRELVLLKVETSSNRIHKILSHSRLLEKIVLKDISKMNSLIIYDLPRLSYAEIDVALEESLEIEAPNLCTLILHLKGSVQTYVSDHDSGYGNYGLKKIVFEHAKLETVELRFNSCARLQIACSNLRTLFLSNKGFDNRLDVEVDAPKLKQLHYEGNVIPSFHGMESLVKPTVTLKLGIGGRPGLDVAVRSCIEMFNHPTVHLSYFYGEIFKAQEILWPGQVQQAEVTSPPPKIKCLIWSISPSTPPLAYQFLLDGSLCSCHPEILRVEAHPLNWEFIRFLSHELHNIEENPSCCKDEPKFRCWRHYLKSVNVEIQSHPESEKPKTSRGKVLTKILKYSVQFNMNWSRD
ncbi:unnamed protein product [Sphenostylis stenocarpa]|uniref:F-box domain-containing protein n=1 Tax=Sphenostylis stenocarpa TaxID=92480 RepID=A0AA86SE97_9FABA|nr:unnamed protein product [Sphenostylis stenocarpa]